MCIYAACMHAIHPYSRVENSQRTCILDFTISRGATAVCVSPQLSMPPNPHKAQYFMEPNSTLSLPVPWLQIIKQFILITKDIPEADSSLLFEGGSIVDFTLVFQVVICNSFSSVQCYTFWSFLYLNMAYYRICLVTQNRREPVFSSPGFQTDAITIIIALPVYPTDFRF